MKFLDDYIIRTETSTVNDILEKPLEFNDNCILLYHGEGEDDYLMVTRQESGQLYYLLENINGSI